MTPEPRSYSAFVAALADILERLEIPYAIAGSMASGLYGEPRTTLDVDLTLQLAPIHVERLASDARQIDLAVDDLAVQERLREARPQPFNIIDEVAGWKADCYLLRNGDYDRASFQRRQAVEFPAAARNRIWVYAPEDVILYKLVYYKMSHGVSTKHLRDIAGMLRQADSGAYALDTLYIERWAGVLDISDAWSEITST